MIVCGIDFGFAIMYTFTWRLKYKKSNGHD